MIFVLRDVEEMSTSDAAEALEISEELRKNLYARAGMEKRETFTFRVPVRSSGQECV